MANQTEETESALIRILTYLITPESDLQEGDEGYDLVKWVKDMHAMEFHSLNPFSKKITSCKLPRATKILCVLRECLLSQRWGECFQLVRNLINDHTLTAHTVFKVGLELSHQTDPGRGRLLEKLLTRLRKFPVLSKYDLYMEYVFFLLTQKDGKSLIQDALDIFKTYKKQRHSYNSTVDNSEREAYEGVLLEAYRGLLLYAQWLVTKTNINNLHNNDADLTMIEEVEAAHEEKTLQILSDRALGSLKVIQGQKGVWDIFITKYVQLVEDRDWPFEAERVLKCYSKDNPQNPNAYRYLLEHYRKQGLEEDAYKTHQLLAKMLPSEPLVLDLYDLHKLRGAGVLDTLPLLFNLLDFSCWQNSLTPWKHLAEDLLGVLDKEYNEDAALAIQKCYSPRLSWWPPYHFSVYATKVVPGISPPSHSEAQDRNDVRREPEPEEPDWFDMSQDVARLPSGCGRPDDWQQRQDELEADVGLQVLVYKAAVAIMLKAGDEFVGEVKQLAAGNSALLEIFQKSTQAAGNLAVFDVP